jgi:hypothetical protein
MLPGMTSHPEPRPTRDQLRRRLGHLKRGVIVLAAGLFAAVATLAAGRTTASGQGSTGTPNTGSQSTRDQQDQAPSGSFWFNPDDGSGSLDSGSNAGPPVAGTHAS